MTPHPLLMEETAEPQDPVNLFLRPRLDCKQLVRKHGPDTSQIAGFTAARRRKSAAGNEPGRSLLLGEPAGSLASQLGRQVFPPGSSLDAAVGSFLPSLGFPAPPRSPPALRVAHTSRLSRRYRAVAIRPLESIRGDFAKLPVEVDADPIEVDAGNELGLARTIGRLEVRLVLHGRNRVR